MTTTHERTNNGRINGRTPIPPLWGGGRRPGGILTSILLLTKTTAPGRRPGGILTSILLLTKTTAPGRRPGGILSSIPSLTKTTAPGSRPGGILSSTLLLTIIAALLLAACGTRKERAEQKKTQLEADSMLAAYHYSDSLYAACGRIDPEAFNDFITRAVAFAEAHPQDTLAPDMLYRAGIGSMILAKAAHDKVSRAENAKRALAIFRQFQELFPDHPQERLCYWQRAIVYDDILGDWRSAETEYRDFINRYPDDPLTPQFQEYLKMLGKSESELSSMYNEQ